MIDAQTVYPRRDRWVVALVVTALLALILGFAASAPAFDGDAGAIEIDMVLEEGR